MAEKSLITVAPKRNVVGSKKKKVYKNPAPVKFLPRNNKFLGTCNFCGVQVGWASTPACGRG